MQQLSDQPVNTLQQGQAAVDAVLSRLQQLQGQVGAAQQAATDQDKALETVRADLGALQEICWALTTHFMSNMVITECLGPTRMYKTTS